MRNPTSTIKARRILGDIRHSFSPPSLEVAQTVIAFDESSGCCRAAANAIESLASAIDPKLAEAVRPAPFDVGNSSGWESIGVRTDAWNALTESIFVVVPRGPFAKAQPALTLILPCRLLLENDERRPLLDQLAAIDDSHSSIVCLFMDDSKDEPLQGGWMQAAWSEWQTELQTTSPRAVVRFYLVGRIGSDSRMLLPEDAIAVVAHAVLADILLREQHAPRYLTQSTDQPAWSIGCLGMTGQIVSAEAIARRVAPRLCRDFLDETRRGVHLDTVPVATGSPADPFTLLTEAFEGPLRLGATALLSPAESRHARDYETPALVGMERRFAIGLPGASKSLAMDNIPPSRWRARLEELERLVGQESAADIVKSINAKWDALVDRNERALTGILKRVFVSTLDPEAVDSTASDIIRSILTQYGPVMVSGCHVELDQAFRNVRDSVEQLTSRRLDFFYTLFGVFASVVLIVILNSTLTGTLRTWGTWLTATGAVSAFFWSAVRWLWARYLAGAARDEALAAIQRECQAAICQDLLELIEETARRLCETVNSTAMRLRRAAAAIDGELQTAGGNHPSPQQSPIDQPCRSDTEVQMVYQFVVGGSGQRSTFQQMFAEWCECFAARCAAGEAAPEAAGAELRSRMEQTLTDVLTSRLPLWQLFGATNSIGEFDDAEFATRVTRWRAPFFCGCGDVVGASSWDVTSHTFWICPEPLSSRIPCDAAHRLPIMKDRVLAMHRLTFAPEQSTETEPCAPDGIAIPCDPACADRSRG